MVALFHADRSRRSWSFRPKARADFSEEQQPPLPTVATTASTVRTRGLLPWEVRRAATTSAWAPAYGLRLVADGKVVAYSGGAEWTGTLLELSAGADLFICVAYVLDKPMPADGSTLARAHG